MKFFDKKNNNTFFGCRENWKKKNWRRENGKENDIFLPLDSMKKWIEKRIEKSDGFMENFFSLSQEENMRGDET